MKYTRLSSHNTPSSVQDWLEEELENRGIDGVIYTRYILSVLQDGDDEEDEEEEEDDDDDEEDEKVCDEREYSIEEEVGQNSEVVVVNNDKIINEQKSISTTANAAAKRHLNQKANSNNRKLTNKYLHKRYQQQFRNIYKNAQQQSKKWYENSYQDCSRFMNIEQKRSVVVECLKSASEQDFEIESLVDELCAKLREYKYSKMGHSQGTNSNEKSISTATICNSGTEVTTESTTTIIKFNTNEKNIVDNESKILNTCKQNTLKEQARRYYAAFPALTTNTVNGEQKQANSALITSNTNTATSATDFNSSSSDNQKANVSRQLKDASYKENEVYDNNKWDKVIEYNMKHSFRMDQQEEMVNFNQNKLCINEIENLINNNHNDDMNINTYSDQSKITGENILLKQSQLNEIQSLFISEKVRETQDLFANIGKRNHSNSLEIKELNFCKTEDDEKYKILFAKFDSNIASLWNDEKIDCYNRESIWCFENNESPLSPNNNSNNNCFSSIYSNIWKSNTNADKNNENDSSFTWDSVIKVNKEREVSDYQEFGNKNKLKSDERTTTLSNHGEDSLFVEVTPSNRNNIQEYGFLSFPYQSDVLKNNEKETESLLTSSKTHFQPIKQESLDDEFDSLDGEVSSLVPCSGKCPNNIAIGSKTSDVNESKHRSLSTSLSELSSIMGPFVEDDDEDDEDNLETNDYTNEMDYNVAVNSEQNHQLENLKVISPTKVKSENDFDQLCSMLNTATTWKWYNEETENLETFKSDSNSWGYYKEATYKNDIANSLVENKYSEKSAEQKIGYDHLLSCNVDLNEQVFANNDLLDRNEQYTDIQTSRDYLSHLFSSNIEEETTFKLSSDDLKSNIGWSTGEVYQDFVDKELPSGDHSDQSQIYYSWNLEKEWQEEEKKETANVLKKDTDTRRPCSFFLEGNCRRSDCKFSHDLSNITCKFWEESSCFKGALCPFLHGYPSIKYNGNPEDDSNIINTINNVSNKEFVIESETDFPALTNSEQNALDSETGDCFSNIVIGKSKYKPEKQESNVLFRIVKKKQKKAGQRNSSERAV